MLGEHPIEGANDQLGGLPEGDADRLPATVIHLLTILRRKKVRDLII
jgi:hypothetical protein